MKRAADLCTLLRVALAPLFAYSLAVELDPHGLAPLSIFALAAMSDFADGRLARAADAGTRAGRLFDHGADAIFLFPALVVLALDGRLPMALPIAAVAAFALYTLDGVRRAGSLRTLDLLPSQSGAVAGVSNYAIAGMAAGAAWLGPSGFDRPLYAAALVVAAANAVAAIERAHRLLVVSQPASARH